MRPISKKMLGILEATNEAFTGELPPAPAGYGWITGFAWQAHTTGNWWYLVPDDKTKDELWFCSRKGKLYVGVINGHQGYELQPHEYPNWILLLQTVQRLGLKGD